MWSSQIKRTDVQSVIETHSDNFNQAKGRVGYRVQVGEHACHKKKKRKKKNIARWLANHMANRKAVRKMSEFFKGLGSHLIRTLLDKEAFLAWYSQMTSKCHVSPASWEEDAGRWIILSETNMPQFKDAKIKNQNWRWKYNIKPGIERTAFVWLGWSECLDSLSDHQRYDEGRSHCSREQDTRCLPCCNNEADSHTVSCHRSSRYYTSLHIWFH